MLNSLSSLFRSSRDLTNHENFIRTLEQLGQNGWHLQLSSQSYQQKVENSDVQVDIYVFDTSIGAGLVSVPVSNHPDSMAIITTKYGVQRVVADSLKSESKLRASEAFQVYIDQIKASLTTYGMEIDPSALIKQFETSNRKVCEGGVEGVLEGFKRLENFDTLFVDVVIPNGFMTKPAWSGLVKLLNEPVNEVYKPNPEFKCIPKIFSLLPDLGVGQASKGLKDPVFDAKRQGQKAKEILFTFKKLVIVMDNLKKFYYIPMEGISKLHEHLKAKATVKIDGLLKVTTDIVNAVDEANPISLVSAYTTNHLRFAQEFTTVSVSIYQAKPFINQLISTTAHDILQSCKRAYEDACKGDGSLPSIYTSITKTVTDLCILFKEFRQASNPSVEIDIMVDQILKLGSGVNTQLQQTQDQLILFELDNKIKSNGRLTSGNYITDIVVKSKGILLFDKFLVILNESLKFETKLSLKECSLIEELNGFIIKHTDNRGVNMFRFEYDNGTANRKKSKFVYSMSEEHQKHFMSNLRHYILMEAILQFKQGDVVYRDVYDEMNVYFKICETASINHNFQFQKRNDVAMLLFDENYDISNVVPSLSSYNVVVIVQQCSESQYRWACRVQETEYWAVNENRFLIPPLKDQPLMDLATLQNDLRAILPNALLIKKSHPVFYTSADISKLEADIPHFISTIPIEKPVRERIEKTQVSSVLSNIFNMRKPASQSIHTQQSTLGRIKRGMTRVVKTILPRQNSDKIKMELKRVVEIVKYLSELKSTDGVGSKSVEGVFNEVSFKGADYDAGALLEEVKKYFKSNPENVFTMPHMNTLLKFAQNYGQDSMLVPFLQIEVRHLRLSKQRFLYEFSACAIELDKKMESKQLQFYQGDFYYKNAASVLSTLFWSADPDFSSDVYQQAREDLLECFIFNYTHLFGTENEKVKKNGEEAASQSGKPLSFVPSAVESIPKSTIAQRSLLTAGFLKATAVELDPLPVTLQVDTYHILEAKLLENLCLVSEERAEDLVLDIDSKSIYACLEELQDQEQTLKVTKNVIEKPQLVLDDTTWTSFNTFDLPPLQVGVKPDPPLLNQDSQKSIF